MADDEMQAEESGQEPEQIPEEDLFQEPDENPQHNPDKKEKDSGGLLLPILYALLAAVGAFTLVMIIGIVVTFITRPAQPSESPSARPSAQATQTEAPQASDSESPDQDNAG